MGKVRPYAFVCMLVMVVITAIFTISRELKETFVRNPRPAQEKAPLSSIPHLWESLGYTQFEEPDIPARRNLTVVTAFIDIGVFPKSDKSHLRSKNTYLEWMRAFEFLENPIVLYTNSTAMVQAFRKMRIRHNSKTQVILISTDDLWSFQKIGRIKTLFSSENYPKHYPNTVVPAYACVTHAKFQILADAVMRKYYNTKYYAWYDIGFFKHTIKRKKSFWIEVPSDFDQTKIAVTRAYNAKLKDVSVRSIIGENRNWVAGGVFLGVPDTILKFHLQYKDAILRYLDQGVMSVEQQMLYAMYTDEERKKHPLSIDLQTYIPGRKKTIFKDEWHYLGYLMYHELMTESKR